MHAPISGSLPTKTSVRAQATTSPLISINDYQLEVLNTYLGSTASNKLPLEKQMDRRTGTTASTLALLGTRLWENPQLKTKVSVYNACVLLYTSIRKRILDSICCSKAQIKRLLYALAEEAAWGAIDEQDTEHSCAVQMRTTSNFHDTLSTQSALTWTCPTNVRRKNSQLSTKSWLGEYRGASGT